MNKAVYDPEKYCPICGDKLPPDVTGPRAHRCNPKVLSAIDAARKRDYVQLRQPREDERLKDGFALMADDSDPNDSEPDPESFVS